MFTYTLYDLILQSNIAFGQLLEYKPSEKDQLKADINISVREGDELKKRFSDVIEHGGNWGLTENGRWFCNRAGVFLLETVDDKSTMICERYEGIPDQMVRSFLLGNCIAIVMTQRKKIVIHGSSIVLDGKTVMICGDSGTGKSTTSMALIDNGGSLMADDISVLDVDTEDGKVYSLPGFPEQKLCRDAAEDNGMKLNELTYIDEDRDKFSVDRREIFINEKHTADILLALHIVSANEQNEEFEKGVRIKEITGADKVNAITDRFFLIWMYNKSLGLEPSEMMKVFALAGQIRIFDITRVEGIDTKDYMVNRIMQLLK